MRKLFSVFLSFILLAVATNSFASPAITDVQKQKQTVFDDTSPQLQSVATAMIPMMADLQSFYVDVPDPSPDVFMQEKDYGHVMGALKKEAVPERLQSREIVIFLNKQYLTNKFIKVGISPQVPEELSSQETLIIQSSSSVAGIINVGVNIELINVDHQKKSEMNSPDLPTVVQTE